MNISPWVKAELIIKWALESHRKFLSKRQKRMMNVVYFFMWNGELQVDPRQVLAKGHPQIPNSAAFPETSQPRLTIPLNKQKLGTAAKWLGTVIALLPGRLLLHLKVKKLFFPDPDRV